MENFGGHRTDPQLHSAFGCVGTLPGLDAPFIEGRKACWVNEIERISDFQISKLCLLVHNIIVMSS
jgi:hypothetical protein